MLAEDVQAIAAAVVDQLAPRPQQLLNADQAAELLSVPASWLLAEARANRVPHHRLGKYVRFKASELDEWLERRKMGLRR